MNKKNYLKRTQRIRKKLKKYNNDRFRISIYKSSRNLSAQIIDDKNNKTLISASSLQDKDTKMKKSELPIGVSCRTCDRLDCSQRAFPPLHKKFDVDINSRGVSVYVNE